MITKCTTRDATPTSAPVASGLRSVGARAAYSVRRANLRTLLKRLLLGRAMRSDRLGETLLPKRLALPVFASDALSSVAYAPDEIFLTLGLAGGALALTHSWQIALARRRRHARRRRVLPAERPRLPVRAAATTRSPRVNLGPKAGLTVASALLVDYVLTVAVSVSSGVQNAAAALAVRARARGAGRRRASSALLTAMNLRGVRESRRRLRRARPTCSCSASSGWPLVGVFRQLTGDPAARPRAPGSSCIAEPGHEAIGRARDGVPAAARVLVRLRGADRRRGDQQRRPGLPEAEEQERRHHAAAHGV